MAHRPGMASIVQPQSPPAPPLPGLWSRQGFQACFSEVHKELTLGLLAERGDFWGVSDLNFGIIH